VKWKRITQPKEIRGWGVKNVLFLTKILAAKILWILIHNKSLWGEFISKKYFASQSLEDWIKNPKKLKTLGSIGWSAMMDAYHLIGDFLCWKIGNGSKVRIGEDPWISGGGGFKLSNGLIEDIHLKGSSLCGMQR